MYIPHVDISSYRCIEFLDTSIAIGKLCRKGSSTQRDPEGALAPKGPQRGPDPKGVSKGPTKVAPARTCGCRPAAAFEGVFKLQTQCKFCRGRPNFLFQ